MKLVIALLASVMFLSACDQDPLKNASDTVRNGRPPAAGKPVPEKALPKDVVQIDGPQKYSGRVNVPVEITFAARILVEGIPYDLSILNLADFPGATFDPATGVFKWTPTKAMISGYQTMFEVRVAVDTPAIGKYVASRETKSFPLEVMNDYTRPIINKITGPTELDIGGFYNMTVEIEDLDALSAADIKVRPVNCQATYRDSVAHFVRISKVEPIANTPNKFTGSFTFSLQSSTGSLTSGNYCFGLVATSKYGVSSEQMDQVIEIRTKLQESKITVSDIYVNTGDLTQVSFSIYDPTAESELSFVSADTISDKLPGSTVTCQPRAWKADVLDCLAAIDARNVAPIGFRFGVNVKSTHRATKKTLDTTHKIYLNVKGVTP